MSVHNKIGIIGENIAKEYLEKNRYIVLERNFRGKYGEIDLIAKNNEMNIIFIEVKTRTNLQYGSGSESVNFKKKSNIIKTAKKYIYINNIKNKNIRFDVIEIYIIKNKYMINHIKNAF